MNHQKENYQTYFQIIWGQFKKKPIALGALIVFLCFVFVGLYAPFFASSKPIFLVYDGKVYFPLFRYLFFTGFYTKPIDIFYNVLMFILPIGLLGGYLLSKYRRRWLKPFLLTLVFIQFALFTLFELSIVKNPAGDKALAEKRQENLQQNRTLHEDPLLYPYNPLPTFAFDLSYLSDYEKLNALLRYRQRKEEQNKLKKAAALYKLETGKEMPTLFSMDQKNLEEELTRLDGVITRNEEAALEAQKTMPNLTASYVPFSLAMMAAKKEMETAQKNLSILETRKADPAEIASAKEQFAFYESAFKKINAEGSKEKEKMVKAKQALKKWENGKAKKTYLLERQSWLENEQKKITFEIPALLRPFHWEDDAGGQQGINKYIPFWHLTRINRKDLVSALLFGVRISLVVGVTSVALSLLIGIPIGMIAGYFAGKVDIAIFRFIEIWEAMPTFFMLLLVVAIVQSKSIFLVIAVLGIFGWTGFGRFIRGETLKQRSLPYVLAGKGLGFSHPHIIFSHILPNAIPPILTLLPFSMMAAITSEAGLSFLGLGEEGSPSWGVLMDEGRSVFPGESYLLWPPAILLTILLISIAIVGDAIRDAIDPKMRK